MCLAAVMSVLGRCIIWEKAQSSSMKQIVAPLPADLLTPDKPPFSRVEVDYFGLPQFQVGRLASKQWGVIFTCLNFKGTHF